MVSELILHGVQVGDGDTVRELVQAVVHVRVHLLGHDVPRVPAVEGSQSPVRRPVVGLEYAHGVLVERGGAHLEVRRPSPQLPHPKLEHLPHLSLDERGLGGLHLGVPSADPARELQLLAVRERLVGRPFPLVKLTFLNPATELLLAGLHKYETKT